MSTPSPDPAEGSETPKTPGSGPADTSTREEPAVTPPTAELLVTPAAEEAPLTAVAPEPAWAQLIREPTFGQAIVIVTGVLLFIWSFLPWYSDAGGSANAWSTVTIPGLVMTATWVPVLSLALVIFLAIKVFGNGFPDTILGFSWPQLCIVAGFFDVLISLGFLVANRSFLHLGAGLILTFITSLVMLAGGIFDQLEIGTESFSRLRPPEARRGGDRPENRAG